MAKDGDNDDIVNKNKVATTVRPLSLCCCCRLLC